MGSDELVILGRKQGRSGVRKPALFLKECPSRGLVQLCLCLTYRNIRDERLGGIGQHGGGPHNCVAGAHWLHIHISRVRAADSFMGHILSVGRPRGQGLESGRGRLREPTSAQGPLFRHCGGRDFHVKAGRT